MRNPVLSPQSQSLRPRPGQRLILEFFDLRIPGTIESIQWDVVRFRLDSRASSTLLKPRGEITTAYSLAHGLVRADLVVVSTDEQFVHLQFIGEPVVLQRRHHPRLTVSVPARLSWRPIDGGVPVQLVGRTQNLSLGGARVRFERSHAFQAAVRTAAFLELDLPGGAVSMMVKFLQIWDDGARVRLVDVDSEDEQRLSAFLDEGLTRVPLGGPALGRG